MKNYIFYDTETTGAAPRFDQILQAAAILTDEDFVERDSFDERSRLATHIVPSAGALRVTGVDPYDIARAKHSPYEFALLLQRTFTAWAGRDGAAYIGFNTINFDEEIVRQMFWENLLEPYMTSKKGNTRNDLLIMLRALHARNPDVIEFPVDPVSGKKSFRLEKIAPANGFSGHNAHDALGDVRATIHVARMIRDVDFDLFTQMMAMGDARSATDFVDSNVVFRMLGGPMVNPGVLDVCLIASEATNTKNKSGWNLAVDPTPYLDMTAEQVLAAMRKTGTPFRTIKCNKSPAVFPIGWEFLHRVSTDAYQPADAVTIDMRAEMIRSHEGFQLAVAEALRLKSEAYGAPETLEESIYSGFPSWADKKLLENFHATSDWAKRLEIVRTLEKPELRKLGLRTIYVNGRDALPEAHRTAMANAIAETRHTLDTSPKWNTVGKIMEEIDALLAEDPEDADTLNILAWVLQTYPQAANWEAWKLDRAAQAERAAQSAANQAAAMPSEAIEGAATQDTATQDTATQDIAACDANNEPAPVSIEDPDETPASTPSPIAHASDAHFLDGLE